MTLADALALAKSGATSLNTFRLRPQLLKLPRLVFRQRRLERRVVKLEKLQGQEKACRDAIDALLVAAGVGKGEGVTCLGYDVVHNERRGRTSISAERLRGAGVPEVDIQFATVTGEPSSFATVRPMKGTEVQA